MRRERGSVSVEFVVILPLLLVLIGAMVSAGRAWLAHAAVQQFADSAARQASIARNASDAAHRAASTVESDAAHSDLECLGGPQVTVDVSGFGVPVGQAATVSATVRCSVAVSDLLLPGFGPRVDAVASSTSTLDRYRARS